MNVHDAVRKHHRTNRNIMTILWNPISEKSNGGTELLARRLEDFLPEDISKEVQIVPSRLYGDLDETKIRILWLHDCAGDPESDKLLKNQGWRKFHLMVFVSNFQMQMYIAHYQLPWSRCMVIPNSIIPIKRETPWDGGEAETVRFIYHTTPHRGLNILYSVFAKLAETHKDIHLDVYSSFDIYGWGERNKDYQNLFDAITSNEAMTYHGSVSNDEVRAAVAKAHVFAYPSIWCETSCLCLMEAMSAGLVCIHPNYGALYETAANWTVQYQFREDQNQHAAVLHGYLDNFLQNRKSEALKAQLENQSAYANIFYNWDVRKNQWVDVIKGLLPLPREFEQEKFVYRPGG
jgi:UDP-glucose:(glucosyl)LPS alpha-1,2-glucosyltransferase